MIKHDQRGAVSLFIVIFTALLITVVTTGFIQIMVRNQQQASNNDLSQSAYDSAMAGVEDAKRALIRLKTCQQTSQPCAATIQTAMDGQTCDTLQEVGVVSFSNKRDADDPGRAEVKVGSEYGYNQAYTCVKVQTQTSDVSGSLNGDGASRVIALKGTGPFDQIRLSWFNQTDAGNSNNLEYIKNGYNIAERPLPPKSEWPKKMPSIMRAQLIQFVKGNINIDSFNGSNAQTLFLYPGTSVNASNGISFGEDARRSVEARNEPKASFCSDKPDQYGGYFCTMTIAVPSPQGGDASNREAYLQLAALYNDANYKIELLNAGSVVPFDGVQPIVDSTGRADSLFRRVKARLNITDGGSQLQFPDAALSVGKDVCKDFFVTNTDANYKSPATGMDCDPSISTN